MNYATIKKTDVANGPGVRVSLFVSGCTHHCKGCFNSEAWDFHYGQAYTEETEQEILQALAPDYIRGLSLLGGEPMEPENRGAVLSLVKKVREQYPQKTIWCYTGYHFDRDLLRWMEEGSGDHIASAAFGCDRGWRIYRGEEESAAGLPGIGESENTGCTVVFKRKMW